MAARELFEKSRSADPNYARAYAGLAWTYSLDYDFGWTDDYDKTLGLTLRMAEIAVRLDNNDYRSHWVLGWAYLYSRDYDKATASYLRARDLNPNDAELLAEMANLLIYIGQPKQAAEQLTQAIRLNPFHENWYVEYLGWAYEEAGMPLEAAKTLEQVIGPKPGEDQLWVLPSLAAAYADTKVGRTEDARRIVKEILTLEPGFSISDTVGARPYKTKEQVDRRVVHCVGPDYRIEYSRSYWELSSHDSFGGENHAPCRRCTRRMAGPSRSAARSSARRCARQ